MRACHNNWWRCFIFRAQFGNRGCEANRHVKVPLGDMSAYLIKCSKPSVKETSRNCVLFVGSISLGNSVGKAIEQNPAFKIQLMERPYCILFTLLTLCTSASCTVSWCSFDCGCCTAPEMIPTPKWSPINSWNGTCISSRNYYKSVAAFTFLNRV